MKLFRKLSTYRRITTFLAIGMLLRSSIAVGYMLDTSPENGDLFSIMICEGPAGINAIADLDSNNDSHAQHHGHHSEHTTYKNTDNNNEHNHAVAQDHPASSCSFWSASSLSLLTNTTFLDSTDYFISEEIVSYETNLKHCLSNNTRLARAPPTLA